MQFFRTKQGKVSILFKADSLNISNTSKNGQLDINKMYERYYGQKK